MMYYDSQGNDGLRYCELLRYMTTCVLILIDAFHISYGAFLFIEIMYLSRQSILRRKEVVDWTTWNITSMMVCGVSYCWLLCFFV